MASNLEAVRAEALFVSTLQCSQRPGSAEVRRAVALALRQFGTRGCAAAVAGEFGDHPEIAVARMNWALAVVHAVYRAHATDRTGDRPTPAPRPVALAS